MALSLDAVSSRPSACTTDTSSSTTVYLCSHPSGCNKRARRKGLCAEHGGGRYCLVEGCERVARPGGLQLCARHGGGVRCSVEGCLEAAVSRSNATVSLCFKHGGNGVCCVEGCRRGAINKSGFCRKHARAAFEGEHPRGRAVPLPCSVVPSASTMRSQNAPIMSGSATFNACAVPPVSPHTCHDCTYAQPSADVGATVLPSDRASVAASTLNLAHGSDHTGSTASCAGEAVSECSHGGSTYATDYFTSAADARSRRGRSRRTKRASPYGQSPLNAEMCLGSSVSHNFPIFHTRESIHEALNVDERQGLELQKGALCQFGGDLAVACSSSQAAALCDGLLWSAWKGVSDAAVAYPTLDAPLNPLKTTVQFVFNTLTSSPLQAHSPMEGLGFVFSPGEV